MSVQVSYKKQFLIYILLGIIVIASVEGLVRGYEYLFWNCPLTDYDVYSELNYFYVRQICLDFRYLAFIEPDVVQLKPNQHFMSINVNNDGFRGPEIKLEKPDNTYRIFAVGGSTTMGHAATSDKATWPAFLEKKFNDENLGINVEVINAGINGAYSFSETYHIRDNILKFDPDLIINYGGVNDADRWIENPQIKTTDEVNEEYEGFKFKNYPFYRTPFMIFSLFFAADYKEQAFPPKTNPHDKVLEAWKSRWIDLCKETNEKGVENLILVQASLGTGNKKILSPDEIESYPSSNHDLEFLRILDSMAGELDEISMTCQNTGDLRDIFDDVSEPIYWDAYHTADLGNEIIAEEIFKLALPIVRDGIQQ